MTSAFLRRVELGWMPSVVERWGNTFKRLLPPLVLTVLVTLGASLAILPPLRWKEITVQSLASLTYWQNWRLAAVSADYFADDHALASPLQHLWSMSMQGQIFVLWPFIMALCVVAARKLRVAPRLAVAGAFGVIAAASLVWLLFFSPDDGSVYFDTRARVWEFALGSLVATLTPWITLPKRAVKAIIPLAFGILVIYCLVSIGTYPGPMAAVPIICVSVLLLWPEPPRSGLVGSTLAARPLVLLGDCSYAVYLVHWPIFVLYLAVVDRPQLNALEGLVLIAVSIALGWAITKLLEDPLRKLRWSNRSTSNKYWMILISLAVGLAPVTAVNIWINERAVREDRAVDLVYTSQDLEQLHDGRINSVIPGSGPGSADHPGARALLGDVVPDFAGIDPIPDATVASKMPHYEGACPGQLRRLLTEKGANLCSTLGDWENAETRVFVAGSSHTQQLLTWQLPPLIESQGWAVLSSLYPGCPWTEPGEYSDECSDHNAKILEYVESNPPDYAFLVVTQTVADKPHEFLIPGVVDLVEELLAKGITVFGVSDNPRSGENLFECSDERPVDELYGGCFLEEEELFSPASKNLLAPLLELEGFHFIDMRDAYCVDGVCPTIIGNMMVYFDSNHITTAYARSVAPFFSQRVLDELTAAG